MPADYGDPNLQQLILLLPKDELMRKITQVGGSGWWWEGQGEAVGGAVVGGTGWGSGWGSGQVGAWAGMGSAERGGSRCCRGLGRA